MERMVIDNHKQTVIGLLEEGEALLRRIGDPEGAEVLRSIREETEKKKEPVVMFYGLYNAGKSTLGNALCNANLRMGDVPTTTSIQEIHWESYTLIDTPGINAQDEHTQIAEGEIRKSDVVLFVVDNADTFDTEQVYRAIVQILKMGKPLAVVVNQKSVDINEDPNIPVPQRASIQMVTGKISKNLTQYAAGHGLQLEKEGCFLGIYPVNARNALKAWEKSGDAAERVLERTGITSLRNVFNSTIRRSEVIYMLRTPLISQRDILRQAIGKYQADPIYGEKQDMSKNREALLTSRQRLRDRLLMDGLRKIEAILEEVKSAVANGQPVEGLEQKISDTLNALIQEAAAQEGAILKKEIKIEAMPDYRLTSTGTPDQGAQDDGGSIAGDLAQIAAFVIDISQIPTPIPIPIGVLTAVIRVIFRLFSGKNKEEDAAARSQEQLANYYRWLNEMRDQEVKIKATYEKSVNDFLAQFYDPELEKLDQALSEVDGSCTEHTKNLRAMEQLMLKVGDEMVALAVTGGERL